MARRWLSAIVLMLLCFGWPRPSSAHPLGNFTVNLYSRLEVERERIALTYVLDMAEVPTYQELQEFGGMLDERSQAAYLDRKASELRQGLLLQIDGRALSLGVESQTLRLLDGQGGLKTLRVELLLSAPVVALTGTAQRELIYEDRNYPDRIGWREVVVRAGSGVSVLRSDVPERDQSDELRAYPEDMLATPPDVRAARVVVAPGSGTAPLAPSAPQSELGSAGDPFAALLARLASGDGPSPLALLLALLLALGFGALHALSPGHGKTIVAAYLVGSRGTMRHACFLGLTVTITHTAGVFALGLVTLFASRYILPEQLYPWLALLSGLLVAGMGLTLLRQRWPALAALWRAQRRSPRRVPATAGDGAHGGFIDGHTPAAVATMPLALATSSGALRQRETGCANDIDTQVAAAFRPRSFGAGVAGMGEEAASPDEPHHHHDHDHDHGHDHAHGHDHEHHHHDHDHHNYDHEQHHDHHHHGHSHGHGPGQHTHLPPGADGGPITWRSLLALGISGGLVPCPSALLVMLAAIGLGRTALGLVLIVAFSLGLAGVLTGVGLLFLYGSRLLGRLDGAQTARLRPALRVLPVLSALVVLGAGLLIARQALLQAGVI